MIPVVQLGLLYGAISAISGYQSGQVYSHSGNQFWSMHDGNNFQYQYRPHWLMTDQKWRSLSTMRTPEWQNPMSKPQWQNLPPKPQWQNDVSKPKWHISMSKPQWRIPMTKPKWKDSLSKPSWNSASKLNHKSKPQWSKPVLKTYTTASVPPAKPAYDFGSREWPEYIPPITMIKPRLDDPPEF